MAIKVPQTRVQKKLGNSTVVAWDLSNCVSVETKASGSGDLDLSSRKVLPTHVVIASGTHTVDTVTLPDAKVHDGRAIVVINNDADEAMTVGGVVCAVSARTVVYSDGTNWAKLEASAIV